MSLPILSICIPTYNRARYLKQSLKVISPQIDNDAVELIISDNCSVDDTEQMVLEYVQINHRIRYVRQEINVGAARNFLSLMHLAKGKYIFLLGDDDILTNNAIDIIVNYLKENNYGTLYMETRYTCNKGLIEFQDTNEYIKKISYFYTFMSSFIFRKDIVNMIDNPQKYIPSHLLQMPFYIKSTLQNTTNAITTEQIFATIGLAAKNNGGYNFFDVFIVWYNKIWSEYVDDKDLLIWLKKDIWPFVWKYTKQLLVKKINTNFKVENGWKILFKYYASEWYFWWTFIKYPYDILKQRIVTKYC